MWLEVLSVAVVLWLFPWCVTGKPLMLLYLLQEQMIPHEHWCHDWNHLGRCQRPPGWTADDGYRDGYPQRASLERMS
jgi:hypothetical protein